MSNPILPPVSSLVVFGTEYPDRPANNTLDQRQLDALNINLRFHTSISNPSVMRPQRSYQSAPFVFTPRTQPNCAGHPLENNPAQNSQTITPTTANNIGSDWPECYQFLLNKPEYEDLVKRIENVRKAHSKNKYAGGVIDGVLIDLSKIEPQSVSQLRCLFRAQHNEIKEKIQINSELVLYMTNRILYCRIKSHAPDVAEAISYSIPDNCPDRFRFLFEDNTYSELVKEIFSLRNSSYRDLKNAAKVVSKLLEILPVSQLEIVNLLGIAKSSWNVIIDSIINKNPISTFALGRSLYYWKTDCHYEDAILSSLSLTMEKIKELSVRTQNTTRHYRVNANSNALQKNTGS